MKHYRSHKEVWAGEITQPIEWNESRGGFLVTIAGQGFQQMITKETGERICDMAYKARCALMTPDGPRVNGGYLVEYSDGYVSWSPADEFEQGYRPIDPTALYNFGEVLEGLKAGRRYARNGWNGKDMFIYLVNGSHFEVNRPPLLGIYEEGTPIDYRAHIDMRTADGGCVPWVASQTDLLAVDWVECE